MIPTIPKFYTVLYVCVYVLYVCTITDTKFERNLTKTKGTLPLTCVEKKITSFTLEHGGVTSITTTAK